MSIKRVQTGYIKDFRYLMTTGCGILLLVDEDVIVEAENTETISDQMDSVE